MMRKQFLKLAIPNILTNLTIPLVSLVDVGLMGRMPSPDYIIAIGLGVVIFSFLYWAFGFLRMGTTGFVAQAYGAKNQPQTNAVLLKGLFISSVAGILIILLQLPIFKAAIVLMNPEAGLEPLIKEYFYIRVWDAPATISLFVITGWLLGMQSSKDALILNILVNGINILCSFLFVYLLNLSIQGVALGTLIGQYSGLILGLLMIRYKYKISFSVQLIRNALKGEWKRFLSVNTDIFIRTMCLIFALSFFKTKAANFDPIIGAANILLIEFITISAYGIDGLAFAAESISGKYFGALNKKKFMQAIKISFKYSLILSLLIAAAFYFFGEGILSLLTNKLAVIEAALPFLPWLVLAPIVNAIAFIWDGVFIGSTSSKEMRNTLLIATFLVFLPSYFLFFPWFGNHGIWLALTLFMLSRSVIQTILFRRRIYPRFS